MLYLHVIDTHDISGNVKSMFVDERDAYKIGVVISAEETDNLVIINSIEKTKKNKRIMKILYVLLNGKEDIEFVKALKIDKKNT